MSLLRIDIVVKRNQNLDKRMKSKFLKYEKYISLIKNIIFLGIGLIGSKFVQFLLLPYFTNVLTPAEYGTVDLVMTFIGLVVPVLTLELSDATLRFGLSGEFDKSVLLKNELVVLVTAAVFAIVLSPSLILYKTIYPWKWYIVILVIVQAFRTNFALFVKADSKVAIYSLDSIVTALIIALCDVFFISYKKIGVSGYFYSEIIGGFCSIFFLLFAGKIVRYWDWKVRFDKVLLKKMLRYSVPLMFNALSWWIVTFSDRFILEIFFSSEEVGIYSVAAKIPAIITTGISVFTQAWIISAVQEYERDKEIAFYKKIYYCYSAFLFVMISCLICVIRPLLTAYVGKDFQEAWLFVPFLLIGSALLGISNYYGAIYAAAKANLLEIKSTIICAVCNVILNIVLIPHFAIMGAVIATMASYGLVVLVRVFDTRKIICLNINFFHTGFFVAFLLLESMFVIYTKYSYAVATVLFILGANSLFYIKKVKHESITD